MTTTQIARATGAMYLLYCAAIFAAWTLDGRWQHAYNVSLLSMYAFYLTASLLFYGLLKSVGPTLAAIATAISVLGCAIGILQFFHVVPSWLMSFPLSAIYSVLLGCLIVRSNFLPRTLGWLVLTIGVGWLVYAVPVLAMHLLGKNLSLGGSFLLAVLVANLAKFMFTAGTVADLALGLWLLVGGIDADRTDQQVAQA